MLMFRSLRTTLRLAFVAGCLAVTAPAARGQTFVELGGGWNYSKRVQPDDNPARGFNLRASVGRKVAPSVRLRFDLLGTHYRDSVQFYPPCAYPGCTHPYYDVRSNDAMALTASGLLALDSREIAYLIGGAGVYNVHAPARQLHLGFSAGAGVAVPLIGRLRAVIEARWHTIGGTTSRSAWWLPVTVGLRY